MKTTHTDKLQSRLPAILAVGLLIACGGQTTAGAESTGNDGGTPEAGAAGNPADGAADGAADGFGDEPSADVADPNECECFAGSCCEPSATGGMAITGFRDGFGNPVDRVRAGRVLGILGDGFPYPPGPDVVLIGEADVPESRFRATSHQQLAEFVVPELEGLPEHGRTLCVRVSDGERAAQAPLCFFPPDKDNPIPDITGVTADDGSDAPIPVGGWANIAGAHFAESPSDNEITFKPLGGAVSTYPPAELDEEQSDPQRVRVRIPDMSEIQVSDGAARVAVVLQVGELDPAYAEFFVYRPVE